MKKTKTIAFILSFVFLVLGGAFRLADIKGGAILMTIGLLGIICHSIVWSIRDLSKLKANASHFLVDILILLMSITFFSKYLLHSFFDYPSIVIVPISISLFIVHLIKNSKYNWMVSVVLVTYLLLSIPLFGFNLRSPGKYIPYYWYDRLHAEKSIEVKLPFSFEYEETKQLSDKAHDFMNANDYYVASSIFEEARKLEPANLDLLFNHAHVYATINRLEDAITLLDTAIVCDSTIGYFYSNRALIHHKMGNYDLALKDYTSAIKCDSLQPVFYANIALLYDDLGQDSLLCDCIRRSEELGFRVKRHTVLHSVKREKCK